MLPRAIYQKNEKDKGKLINPKLPSNMTMLIWKLLAQISITINICEMCTTDQKLINMQHGTQSYFF